MVRHGLFRHAQHLIQFGRLGTAFDGTVVDDGPGIFGAVPFFRRHGEGLGQDRIVGDDAGVDLTGLVAGELFRGNVVCPGIGNDFTGEMVSRPEGNAMVFHEPVGDFLGTGPVEIEFFQGPVGVDNEVV